MVQINQMAEVSGARNRMKSILTASSFLLPRIAAQRNHDEQIAGLCSIDAPLHVTSSSKFRSPPLPQNPSLYSMVKLDRKEFGCGMPKDVLDAIDLGDMSALNKRTEPLSRIHLWTLINNVRVAVKNGERTEAQLAEDIATLTKLLTGTSSSTYESNSSSGSLSILSLLALMYQDSVGMFPKGNIKGAFCDLFAEVSQASDLFDARSPPSQENPFLYSMAKLDRKESGRQLPTDVFDAIDLGDMSALNEEAWNLELSRIQLWTLINNFRVAVTNGERTVAQLAEGIATLTKVLTGTSSASYESSSNSGSITILSQLALMYQDNLRMFSKRNIKGAFCDLLFEVLKGSDTLGVFNARLDRKEFGDGMPKDVLDAIDLGDMSALNKKAGNLDLSRIQFWTLLNNFRVAVKNGGRTEAQLAKDIATLTKLLKNYSIDALDFSPNSGSMSSVSQLGLIYQDSVGMFPKGNIKGAFCSLFAEVAKSSSTRDLSRLDRKESGSQLPTDVLDAIDLGDMSALNKKAGNLSLSRIQLWTLINNFRVAVKNGDRTEAQLAEGIATLTKLMNGISKASYEFYPSSGSMSILSQLALMYQDSVRIFPKGNIKGAFSDLFAPVFKDTL